MKSKNLFRAISLLALLVSLIPAGNVSALVSTDVPPADMFQLPWEQGASWVAYDGFDNGFKRLPNSPHNYLNGGAVDFAPHNNMKLGEDTSNFWVTAAAAGTVVEKSSCHLKINHGNGWITEYQFLANIQVDLGEAVFRNERLAVIANGTTQKFCPPALEPDIPHVHFVLRPNMRDATFSDWVINYNPLFNKTTFTKGDQTLGSHQPILNMMAAPQTVLRDPITWDTVYIGSVDGYRREIWPFTLTETTNFSLTATPTTSGLVPLLILQDANGVELARDTNMVTSTQPAGTYYVEIRAESGSGFYELLLQRSDVPPEPSGPFVSTVVTPASIDIGDTAVATINLNNVPVEGYTSAEFTCTYNAGLAERSNIVVTDLFGPDAVTAINGPPDGSFIVAIAGSNGNKATAGGTAFTFSLNGLQTGQTAIECKARVSKGDNVLTDISSTATNLTILGSVPPPTSTPTPGVPPTATFTPTSPSDWLTFTNSKYGFEFKYPKEGVIADGRTDNSARIDLPFVQGTNLREKYLEVVVAENVSPCQSPRDTPLPGETVIINGITFFKQTAADAGVGHLHQWFAYSTLKDNACVSLYFTLHSLNAGNYATPPPEFDFAAETAVFEQIVLTYAWLIPPTPTPQPTNGILAGQVLASKPVTVGLYNADASLVTSIAANADGTFSLTALAGTYTVIATASGFLSAQGSVTLTGGSTNTKPTVSLIAGDIDGNNVIDQYDAITIGMSYNTVVPAAADLNSDGIINVLDLELLAANYRKSGALSW